MPAPMFPPDGLVMPNPDWGFKESPTADVNEQPLGDGYVFREAKGLNHIKRTFPLTWSNLEVPVAEAAYDWLRPKVKLNPIRFRHPVRGTLHQVIIDNVDIEYDTYGNAVLNLTVTEDFNPVP